jgi:hypothetical protein
MASDLVVASDLIEQVLHLLAILRPAPLFVS